MSPVLGMFCAGCSACVLSTWSVTKHGDQFPSLTGISWVSDGIGIDFTEYMYHKGVHFFSSLEQMIIVDSWERNGAIPVGTKLLLLSNRLQGFRWNRTILNWNFSIHAVVSTYTCVSVTRGSRIFWWIKKLVSAYCERVSPMRLWCKRKRWGFFSTGRYLYLYLHLLYKALVNISRKWKMKRDAGEDETPLVWCMHMLIPKSIISLLYGGSCSFCSGDVWSLVPWGLGLLCKMLDILQLLSSTLFSLWCPSIIIGGHTSSQWSPGPMSMSTHWFSCLCLIWILYMRHRHVNSLCCMCGTQCMHHGGAIFNVSFVFSSFFFLVYDDKKKGFIIVLSQQVLQYTYSQRREQRCDEEGTEWNGVVRDPLAIWSLTSSLWVHSLLFGIHRPLSVCEPSDLTSLLLLACITFLIY